MPEPYFRGYKKPNTIVSRADQQSSPGLPVNITTGVEFPWGSAKAILLGVAETVTLYYKDPGGGADITVQVPMPAGYNPIYGAFKADFVDVGNVNACAIYS